MPFTATDVLTAALVVITAYYAYRNSQQGAHDYREFPLILVVSTSYAAEQRVLMAAERARARFGKELALLTTTTMRLESSGVFGAIWRRAENRALSNLTCGQVSCT